MDSTLHHLPSVSIHQRCANPAGSAPPPLSQSVICQQRDSSPCPPPQPPRASPSANSPPALSSPRSAPCPSPANRWAASTLPRASATPPFQDQSTKPPSRSEDRP